MTKYNINDYITSLDPIFSTLYKVLGTNGDVYELEIIKGADRSAPQWRKVFYASPYLEHPELFRKLTSTELLLYV